MNAEDLDHFLAIIDSMAGDDKNIEQAKARLKDEGLTDEEANTAISAWHKLYGRTLPDAAA